MSLAASCWRKSVNELAGMEEESSRRSSAAGVPLASRLAPLALKLWAQPLPGAPLLPHGQGVVCEPSSPSPKQNVEYGGWRSRTKASVERFVSPPTRLFASLEK